jgi:hypothetical protein
MTSLVAQLGGETAAVFEGVPPEEWCDHLEALAMSFTPTANMVTSSKWKSVHVLPALHAQLVQGTAAMGHTMQSFFEMSSLVENPQAQAALTVSEIALAMKEGSGSAAARLAAPEGARVNEAVLEAAEELGRDPEAMEQVRGGWDGWQAQRPRTRRRRRRCAPPRRLRRRATTARTSRSSSTRRSSTRRGTVRTAPRMVRRCGAH